MSLRGLSGNLTREQQLLEVLLYKLEVEHLLLAAGRTDRLPMARRELEAVLSRVQEAELGRAIELDGVAAELGLDPEADLARVAAAAPVPWDSILTEQHAELLRLTTAVRELTSSPEELLAASRRATQDVLTQLRADVVLTDELENGTDDLQLLGRQH